MNYFCCTENRRNAVKNHPSLNGIDYLEVIDNEADPIEDRQTTLVLHLLKPVAFGSLSPSNILIKGGERIRDIEVVEIGISSPPDEEIYTIKVSEAGDFSTYTLCLVEDNQNKENTKALAGFDLLLSKVDFSFKVNCPNDFDCATTDTCPPELASSPQINYLAKDYANFRQLMLDRMALLMPEWTERNPADMGIALVELLAYTADHLSYRQDAITTEAYLGTARKRISVRRHARLVDYLMHDGCNARTWVQLQVGQDVVLKKDDQTKFTTKVNGLPTAFRTDSEAFEQVIKKRAKIFEIIHPKNEDGEEVREDISLWQAHNEMHFYTYGEEECCLPKGATQATLKGNFQNLEVGDVLILAEVRNPENGNEQESNLQHRHAVRLTEVSYGEDINVDFYLNAFSTSPPESPPNSPPESPPISPPNSPPASPPENNMISITYIRWHKVDALPFPLCISHQGETYVEHVSVAYGNVILADHGLTLQDTTVSSLQPDTVPKSKHVFARVATTQGKQCQTDSARPVPIRYQPILQQRPLTFVAPLSSNHKEQSATSAMKWSIRKALPAIHLNEAEETSIRWTAQRDLLIDSAANNRHFVVEMESDGLAHIRFGNDKNGMRPNEATQFLATYRIGNGKAGNIGADTLTHVVSNDPSIVAVMSLPASSVRNPLPAQGGQEGETTEEVRQYAPQAFRTQERAVTTADYEHFAKVCQPDIQKATATFRWTGSWKTAFVTADRLGGLAVDEQFDEDLHTCLEQYRMAGLDLEVDAPIYVPLAVDMIVCVQSNFFKSDVKKSLLEVFSKNVSPNGQLGIFHPDNFSFGQTVYLSRLYAAAQRIQGVRSVEINKFQRKNDDQSSGIEAGKLEFGRREIARLDNDPNFEERGVFNLTMKGGRS